MVFFAPWRLCARKFYQSMAPSNLPRLIEQDLGTEHIRRHERTRIHDRAIDMALGREVHDALGTEVVEHRLDLPPIRDVTPLEAIVRIGLDVAQVLEIAGGTSAHRRSGPPGPGARSRAERSSRATSGGSRPRGRSPISGWRGAPDLAAVLGSEVVAGLYELIGFSTESSGGGSRDHGLPPTRQLYFSPRVIHLSMSFSLRSRGSPGWITRAVHFSAALTRSL